MGILVKYIYNQTKDSVIEHGSDVVYFAACSYEEIASDKEKESELSELVSGILENKYGYYSIKVTSISEV